MKFIVVQRNTVGISRSRKFHVNSILHEITSKTIRQQEKHFNRRGHGKRSDCLVFSLFLAIKLQGKWAKQNDRSLFTWSDENERESLLLEITVENFLLRFRFNSDWNCVSRKMIPSSGRPCLCKGSIFLLMPIHPPPPPKKNILQGRTWRHLLVLVHVLSFECYAILRTQLGGEAAYYRP